VALRRRRRKLTTTLTNVDRRLRDVERRRAPKRVVPAAASITVDQLADDVPKTPEAIQATTGTIKTVPPAVYKRIIAKQYKTFKSFIKPDKATLTTDIAHELVVGDKILVSGLDAQFDLTAPGEDRPNFYSKLRYTYWTVTEVPSDYKIVFTRPWEGKDSATLNIAADTVAWKAVTTKAITSNVVTLTIGSGHTFVVGDRVNIDGVGEEFDGNYAVTAKTSTTVSYKTANDQANITATAGDGGVYPTLIKYVQVGDTWSDPTDGALYSWTGLKWEQVNATIDTTGAFIPDDIAPKIPTNLAGASTAYYEVRDPRARVVLTWTAPTQNVDNTPIEDLVGYDIFYRTLVTDDWKFLISVPETTYTHEGLRQGVALRYAVKAYDKSDNRSDYSAEIFLTTPTSVLVLSRPSAPQLTSRLGTVTVRWNGLDYLGNAMGTTLAYIEIHRSTTTGFTPDATTAIARLNAAPEPYVDADLTYATTYYYKFVAVDIAGGSTDASAQSSVSVNRLVDTDLIANTLSTWPFAGQVVSAEAIANGAVSTRALANGAVDAEKILANAVTSLAIAANAVSSAMIQVNAVTSSQLGPNAVTQAKIADAAITAAKIGANAVEAGKIAANAVTVGSISANAVDEAAIAAAAITGTKIAANAVTAATIQAGAITAGKIDANAVTANSIAANAITAVKLAANAVTAGSIAANAVTAGAIEAGAVTANAIAANAVTAGAIAANAVTATSIDANAITAGKIAANAVVAGSIAANAVTANAIAANSITANAIVANAIGANQIAANAISAGKIAAGTIGADEIGANAIIAGKIATDAVTANTIAANAISAGKIQANAIEADKINVGAITAEKLNVTALDGKIITGSTIRTAASGARIQMDAAGFQSINPSGQTTFFINAASGVVTIGGFATQAALDAANAIAANAAATANAASNTASNAASTANTAYGQANTAYGQANSAFGTANTAANTASNAASTANTAYGQANTAYGQANAANNLAATKITTGAAAADVNAGTVTIDGGKITANSITATQIQARTITAGKINASEITAYEIAGNTITSAEIKTGTITAAEIQAGSITVDRLSAGTLTGFTIRTSSGAGRVELNSSTESLRVLYSSTVRGHVLAASGSTGTGIIMHAGGTANSGATTYGMVFLQPSYGILAATSSKYVEVTSTQVVLSGDVYTLNAFYNQDPSTSANTGNTRMDSDGRTRRSTASSQRYKENIVGLRTVAHLDPNKLLTLPVRAFSYKTDYLDATDDRAGMLIPGFIAEEVAEIYPIAADKDKGMIESWNDRIMVPSMLALIQDLHTRVETLEGK